MRSVQRPARTLCLLVLLLLTLSGCGSRQPTFSISATQSSVLLGENVQFTATGPTVSSWSVNGVNGGSAATGTINTTGLYTAPQVLPSPALVNVGASSSSSSATASLTVTSDVSSSVLLIEPAEFYSRSHHTSPLGHRHQQGRS